MDNSITATAACDQPVPVTDATGGPETANNTSRTPKPRDSPNESKSIGKMVKAGEQPEQQTEKVVQSAGLTKPMICTGCKKPLATQLLCPNCNELGLPPSAFCSQNCFRNCWKEHNKLHEAAKIVNASTSEGTQGLASLRLGITGNTPALWMVDRDLREFDGYKFTGPLRPWPRAPQRTGLPLQIQKPCYHQTGVPTDEDAIRQSSAIEVVTGDDVEKLRRCCLIGRRALDLAHSMVAPGVTTEAIDTAVHNFIVNENNAYPSPLNYYRFPKSCCTSVNEVICHGIPDLRPLEEGDIVNVDITVYSEGMHGDLNETFICGATRCPEDLRLVQAAYDSMMESIAICRPGMLYRDIGEKISAVVEPQGFSVVRAYCGHGIGRLFHSKPNVPHYKRNKAVGIMKPGHVFTIEPMISAGAWDEHRWPDGWTSATIDGQRSAQFEHTLIITDTGAEILTARLGTSPPLEIDLHKSIIG